MFGAGFQCVPASIAASVARRAWGFDFRFQLPASRERPAAEPPDNPGKRVLAFEGLGRLPVSIKTPSG